MTSTDRTDLGLTDVSASNDAGCQCCQTAPSDSAPVVATSASTADVFVDGMTCSHCVMSVTEELSSIEGVENVSVDLNVGGASKLTIASSPPIDAAAVRAAVQEAGYSLSSSTS